MRKAILRGRLARSLGRYFTVHCCIPQIIDTRNNLSDAAGCERYVTSLAWLVGNPWRNEIIMRAWHRLHEILRARKTSNASAR
jgi:hypothetical protein